MIVSKKGRPFTKPTVALPPKFNYRPLPLSDDFRTIKKIVEVLEKSKVYGKYVPLNYLASLKRVQAQFYFQTVYDPINDKLVNLEPVPPNIAIEHDFFGDQTFI